MRPFSWTEMLIFGNMLVFVLLSLFIYNKLAELGTVEDKQREHEQASSYHIALVYAEGRSPYWEQVKHGLTEAAKGKPITFQYLAPETTDMVEQVDLLHQAIARRVDGIIVQGLNEEAFTPVINKAVERGILVVTIQSDAPSSKRQTYVGIDHYQAGIAAGEHLVALMQGKGEVAILLGNFHVTHQRERLKGVKQVVARHPAMSVREIVDTKANQLEAMSQTIGLVSAYPLIQAVVGLSSWDGPGIAQGLQRLGKQDVHVVAFDLLPETKTYLKQGMIDAVVSDDPYTLGRQAAEMMMALQAGRPVQEQTYTRVKLLTKEDRE